VIIRKQRLYDETTETGFSLSILKNVLFSKVYEVD